MPAPPASDAARAAAHSLPAPPPGRRDWLLRLVLLAAILGAVLTVIEAALPVAGFGAGATVFGVSAAAYHQVLVPLLALVALAGALILDKQVLCGLLLLVGGALLALPGGAYLAPAAALGAGWAAWRHAGARLAVGLVLLIPGAVAGYYGLAAAITLAGGRGGMPGLPPSLDPPLRWAQLALPLGMLAVAWLGAWLLLECDRARS